MKNFFKILPLFLISQIVYAQTINEGVKFGLRAGANLSKIQLSGQLASNELKNGIKPLLSYNFGLYANIPISKVFSFQPGLSIVGKGTKLEINRNDSLKTGLGIVKYNQITKRELNIAYLEVPLNLIFNYENFFIGAGPYVAYALFGTDKESDEITLSTGAKVRDNNPPAKKIIIGNGDNADIRPWDIGANATVGYQLNNGLNFSANYAINLAKTDYRPGFDIQMSNRVLTFFVGFAF